MASTGGDRRAPRQSAYQYGNSSGELAKTVADDIAPLLAKLDAALAGRRAGGRERTGAVSDLIPCVEFDPASLEGMIFGPGKQMRIIGTPWWGEESQPFSAASRGQPEPLRKGCRR